MAHAHKGESKSARSSKLRAMGMGGGQGRSGRDDAAAFDGGATMSAADQAPAGLMPTNRGTDAATAGMYRRGGKVEGKAAPMRMDRVARKCGGRVGKADGGQADLVKSDKASDTKKILDRKADAPLKAKKPQNFDMSDSPLFGDGPKQGELGFKRGGRAKVKDTDKDGDSRKDSDRDGRARGGRANGMGSAGQDAGGGVRSMKAMQSKVQTPGPSPKFARGGKVTDYTTDDKVSKEAKTSRIKRAFGGPLPAQAAPQAMAARPPMPAQAMQRPMGPPQGMPPQAMGRPMGPPPMPQGAPPQGIPPQAMARPPMPPQAAPQAAGAYQRGGRAGRATGGSVKKAGKGGSTVNVIIAPQGGAGGPPAGAMPPPPPPPPVPNQGPPPAPGGGAPPPNGGVAMGGAPGMGPAPGGQPFKRGGRVSSANPLGQAGQHSGEGRINQAKYYAKHGE